MKIILSILLILSLSGCAMKPGTGSYSDAATTYYALEHMNATELNPLLSWGSPAQAAIASIGIKHVAKYGLAQFYEDEHRYVIADAMVETGGMFATGFNVVGILGGGPILAIPIGILTAKAYWDYRDRKFREDIE